MKINMAEQYHVYPLTAPAAVTSATATYTNFVKMSRVGSGQLELALFFGACSATDSTGDYTITCVESSNGVSTDGGTALAFYYRWSSAVGSDDLDDIAASGSTGVVALATAIDNKVLLCYVDPAVVSKEYVAALVTPSADSTSFIFDAVARFVPRYAQAATLAASTT